MKTEMVIKDWQIKEEEGRAVIAGNYAVMLGGKEIATQAFNSGYGALEIAFEREIQDAARELSVKISESIQKSFQ